MNSDQIINPLEPVMHPQFHARLDKYLKIIDDNKQAFIAYDSTHENDSAHDIFSAYWFLEATSSSIQPEKVKLTRKDGYTHLPEELRALIN